MTPRQEIELIEYGAGLIDMPQWLADLGTRTRLVTERMELGPADARIIDPDAPPTIADVHRYPVTPTLITTVWADVTH